MATNIVKTERQNASAVATNTPYKANMEDRVNIQTYVVYITAYTLNTCTKVHYNHQFGKFAGLPVHTHNC